MKYMSSQSYHTLKHWQSSKHSAIYTSYIKHYTGFFIDGAIDESGDLCIFPWSWHESDAVAGDNWNDGSGHSDTAWYIQPSLALIQAYKWTTPDNAYDIYYILYKAGAIDLIPESVPYAADGTLTAKYQIPEHADGRLLLNADSLEYSFTFDSSYIGKVLLPTVARYKAYFNFYVHGDTPYSLYSICKDKGACKSNLSNTKKWNFACIYELSKIIGEMYSPDILSQVPRLTGLKLITWNSLLKTWGYGCIQGGCNANDDDTIMYRAGLGNSIALDTSKRMPYIITGQSSGSRATNIYAYHNEFIKSDGTSETTGEDDAVGSCMLAGDYGRNGLPEETIYFPQAVSYNNNFLKYGYVQEADNGVSTIIRRVTDVKVKEGFKFFS